MVFATIRFAALGWIGELYAQPAFHFTYLGFDWIQPWPLWGLYLHFALMGLSALSLALGCYSRLSAASFFLLFTYAELWDKSAYLNHYYLVSLLALLLAIVPSGATWSLDAWRQRAESRLPLWGYWAFRSQMIVVYFYAGLAKLNSDWLLNAQPLRLWLASFTDVPLLARFAEEYWLAMLMSWAGAIYDLSIPFLIGWKKTRAAAYSVAIAFHVSVWLMFPIGIFPWVMLIGLTTFFNPSWPRRLVGPFFSERFATGTSRAPWAPRWALYGSFVHLLVQAILPLRFVLYPGWVNWNEQGFRFAWRVMLIEKAGHVEFEVVSPRSNERFKVYPRRELTRLQYRMMSTQPDMIHQYALHLANQYRQRGYPDVEVYADAWVSFNGRPSQRLIDQRIDLSREPRTLRPSRFILPLE